MTPGVDAWLLRHEANLIAPITKGNGGPSRPFLRWISVVQDDTVRLVTLDQICYFQANDGDTVAVTAAKEISIDRSIKALVGELDPGTFLQIRRGAVVNVNAIKAVHRDLRGRLKVELKHRDETLEVSSSFAHLFRNF